MKHTHFWFLFEETKNTWAPISLVMVGFCLVRVAVKPVKRKKKDHLAQVSQFLYMFTSFNSIFVCELFIIGIKLKPVKKYEMIVNGDLFIQRCILNLQESPFLCMNANYNASVWLEIDEQEYLLCNVSRDKSQVNLNLAFGAGENIKLFCKGLGVVQLTGQYDVTTFPNVITLLTPPPDETHVISDYETDESNGDKTKSKTDQKEEAEEADITEQT